MTHKRYIASIFATAWLLPTAAQSAETTATDYPNKPIRLIVPFPAGSGPDANARVLAAGLSRVLWGSNC